MYVLLSENAQRIYRKLPISIKKKTDKQLRLLATNPKHPSLRVKKMSGSTLYEGRIDYHYRFVFSWKRNQAEIVTLGSHDEGLGKK